MRGYGGSVGWSLAPQQAPRRRWKWQAVAVLVLVVLSILFPLGLLLGFPNGFPSGYMVDDRSQQVRKPAKEAFADYHNVDAGQEQNSTEEGEPRVTKSRNEFASTLPQDADNSPHEEFHKGNNTVHSPSGYKSRDDISQATIPKDDVSKSRVPVTGNSGASEELSSPNTRDADNAPHEELHKGNNTVHSPSGYKPKDDISQSTIPKDDVSNSRVPVTGNSGASEELSSPNTRTSGEDRKQNRDKGSNAYETGSSCELEFGSYCLWSRRHRAVVKDYIVKRLKDQLFVSRAYFPSIAKLKGYEGLTRELKMNIQDHERMLSEAVSDPDLPPFVEKKIQKMDEVIAKAKKCAVECGNVDRKFRQLLDLTEDEAHFHMKQSAFLYHLGVQTLSKSFHCLSMRLTVEFFKSPPADMEHSSAHKIDYPSYQHYVIFSRNILAVSVTINSTVVNSEESVSMVFHVLTDKEKFYSMKHWFARNSYRKAAIQVLNFDDLKFNLFSNSDSAGLSISEEFRVSSHSSSQPSTWQMSTKYLSVFGHSQFVLSEIFKNLKKVILLDDDVVVQKDISFLWNLSLGGKVLGATEFCGVKLGQLKSNLGSSGYDSDSCSWMSGINIIDLDKWREQDITGIYQRFIQKSIYVNEAQWRFAALPASMLAFHAQIYALDNNLIQQGLGHDYGVSEDTLTNVAALHYNGDMKPWLDLAIPKYKKYWKKYLIQDEHFMEECNVNP